MPPWKCTAWPTAASSSSLGAEDEHLVEQLRVGEREASLLIKEPLRELMSGV